MEVPSKARLDELQAGVSSVSSQPPTAFDQLSDGPPGMPDPEPEVLEAAKALIDGMLKGQGFSEVVDALRGQRLAGAPAAPLVDERLKLKFLAHVLENEPYERHYSLLGGRLVLVFRTVTADVDRQVAEDAMVDSVNRDARYSNGLLAASLQSIAVDGRPAPVIPHEADGNWIYRFTTWAGSIDRPVLQLVHQSFRRFERELAEMLAKADDPSFWPTP